ncbi:hypothetical protein Syun_014575 [Stephania yunnanensis]|uniref:Uncharacterized protein n=1 Tax=Stephania yunnanensis TaxID=152371 RepID=A0AAP0JKG6_9MAGN
MEGINVPQHSKFTRDTNKAINKGKSPIESVNAERVEAVGKQDTHLFFKATSNVISKGPKVSNKPNKPLASSQAPNNDQIQPISPVLPLAAASPRLERMRPFLGTSEGRPAAPNSIPAESSSPESHSRPLNLPLTADNALIKNMRSSPSAMETEAVFGEGW